MCDVCVEVEKFVMKLIVVNDNKLVKGCIFVYCGSWFVMNWVMKIDWYGVVCLWLVVC